MIQTWLLIGIAFGVAFIVQAWLLNLLRKRQLEQIEERMTRNMIKAIEKLEWGEDKNE